MPVSGCVCMVKVQFQLSCANSHSWSGWVSLITSYQVLFSTSFLCGHSRWGTMHLPVLFFSCVCLLAGRQNTFQSTDENASAEVRSLRLNTFPVDTWKYLLFLLHPYNWTHVCLCIVAERYSCMIFILWWNVNISAKSKHKTHNVSALLWGWRWRSFVIWVWVFRCSETHGLYSLNWFVKKPDIQFKEWSQFPSTESFYTHMLV